MHSVRWKFLDKHGFCLGGTTYEGYATKKVLCEFYEDTLKPNEQYDTLFYPFGNAFFSVPLLAIQASVQTLQPFL